MLPPHRLTSVLTTLWLEWHLHEEEYVKARARMVRTLADSAGRPSADLDEEVVDNPFPGVMRGGPAGVVKH